jgi:hypothetical protein
MMLIEEPDKMWTDEEIAMFNRRMNRKINRGNWIWKLLNKIGPKW